MTVRNKFQKLHSGGEKADVGIRIYYILASSDLSHHSDGCFYSLSTFFLHSM